MSVSSLGAEARQKFPFESDTSRQFGKLGGCSPVSKLQYQKLN